MADGAPRLSGVDVDHLVVDPSRYSPSTHHDRSSKFSRVLIGSFYQSCMHCFAVTILMMQKHSCSNPILLRCHSSCIITSKLKNFYITLSSPLLYLIKTSQKM